MRSLVIALCLIATPASACEMMAIYALKFTGNGKSDFQINAYTAPANKPTCDEIMQNLAKGIRMSAPDGSRTIDFLCKPCEWVLEDNIRWDRLVEGKRMGIWNDFREFQDRQ